MSSNNCFLSDSYYRPSAVDDDAMDEGKEKEEEKNPLSDLNTT